MRTLAICFSSVPLAGLALAGAVLAGLALAGPGAGVASAQAVERPADDRPELEPFEPEAPTQAPIALPLPPPPSGRGRLPAGLTIQVDEIRVEGSTVFEAEELQQRTAPWTGRTLDSYDLQELADSLTRLYTEKGYVSSGVVIPDQDLEGGVLVLQAVEGRLTDVIAEGNRWYRDAFLESRIESAIRGPVNVHEIEEQLQLLLREPALERVRAELRPGERRGDTVLVLSVEERTPLGLRGSVDNDNPPGIGSVRGRIEPAMWSVFGFGDRLEGRFDLAEGLNSQELRYGFPLPIGLGTELLVRFRRTDSEIVNDFKGPLVESETWTLAFGVRQPLLRSTRQQLDLTFFAERRESQTLLNKRGFPFVPGPDRNGRSDISVLRFGQNWTWRTRRNVIAARSLVSVGIDVLDATRNPPGIPDGRFVAWLAQGQWAHRLPESLWGSEIIARGDLQLTDDPLLSLEQIAVGGASTVRGYRRNLLVADQAFIGSVELRVPILRKLLGPDVIEFAPFADFGQAWNKQRAGGSNRSDTIGSAGVGLRYRYADRVFASVYYGGAFRDFPTTSSNIQDDGVHLRIELKAF